MGPVIRSSSVPAWTTPLLLVACATRLSAQRPPFDDFPPADPHYYRVRGATGKNHSTLNNDLGLPDDKPTEEMFEFLSRVSRRQ